MRERERAKGERGITHKIVYLNMELRFDGYALCGGHFHNPKLL